jgi:hypothetical protein
VFGIPKHGSFDNEDVESPPNDKAPNAVRSKEQRSKEQRSKEQRSKEQRSKEQRSKEQRSKEQRSKEQRSREQRSRKCGNNTNAETVPKREKTRRSEEKMLQLQKFRVRQYGCSHASAVSQVGAHPTMPSTDPFVCLAHEQFQ